MNEIVEELLPNGLTIIRVTGSRERYYQVLDPNRSPLWFEPVPGRESDRLISTTKITGFPDKSGPLTWWAAGEAAKHFAAQMKGIAPRTISNGNMAQAKPYTMLLIAARDWLLSGENIAAVRTKLSSLNAAFKEPLDDNSLSALTADAEKAAQATMNRFNGQLSAVSRAARAAHNREKNRTSDLGTRVHSWVELDMKGVVQEIPDDIAAPISAYKKWRKTEGIASIIALEKMIYHPTGFAGTVDAVLRLTDGRVAVVDFKTSASIYDSHILQIGAYARAWEHVHGDPVPIGWVARFGREDGAMETFPVNTEPAWQAFSALIPGFVRHNTLKKDTRAQ